MAEPLVISGEPLDCYLQNSVMPSELPSLDLLSSGSTSSPSSSSSTPTSSTTSTFLMSPSFSFIRLHDMLATLLSFLSFFSSPTCQKSSPTESFDHVQARLSERLKYLICSSFLLSPRLDPSFYDALSTQPLPDLSQPLSTSPATLSSPSPPLPSPPPPPPPTYFLFAFAFLIAFLSYLPPWISSLFLLLALALFIFLFHYHSHFSGASQADPLQIQSDLVPAIAELVSSSQAIDVRLSRAMGAIKEVECVALGLSISHPMPPVSRLECASFPFAQSDTPQQSHNHSRPSKLHAIRLRKVVKTVLEQARHLYEKSAAELEVLLTSFSSNLDAQPPLQALMELYGCSRDIFNIPSVSDQTPNRNRQQSWRLSSPPFHAANPRSTWQPSLAVSRIPPQSSEHTSTPKFNHHHNNPFDDSKTSSNHPTNIPVCSPPPELPNSSSASSDELYANALGMSSTAASGSPSPLGLSPRATTHRELLSPDLASTFTSSIRDRTSSVDKRVSLGWGPNPSLRPSPSSRPLRPVSMFVPSSSRSRRSSYERYRSASAQVIEPQPEPLSLLELQLLFERMHLSRKRLLCAFLALDFSCPLPGPTIWAQTVKIARGLIEAIESLGVEVNEGMSSEFGPGSFETKAVFSSSSSGHPSRRSSVPIIDFAPPRPLGEIQEQERLDVIDRLKSVDCLLRTLTAKLNVTLEDLGNANRSGALERYESMGPDLERLGREWDSSRCKLRQAVEGSAIINRAPAGQQKLRPESIESNCGGESGGTSSVFSSEVLTPVDEEERAAGNLGNQENQQDEEASRQQEAQEAFGIKALSGLEEVFEAVASRRSSVTTGHIKLSRQERIQLAKEKRESMPVIGRKNNSMALETDGVVTELKDVLSVLKARRLKELAQQTPQPTGRLQRQTLNY